MIPCMAGLSACHDISAASVTTVLRNQAVFSFVLIGSVPVAA